MKPTLLLLVQLAFGLCLFGQADDRRGNIRMAFYNVENFFDTTNDSLTLDDEFLPGTSHDWTPYRFRTKTHQLFQALAAVGGTEAPEIIGLAEIENRQVLEELAYRTPFSRYPYRIVHFDSPDLRGIDVGLLYRSDKLQLIGVKKIPILFPDYPRKRTRDILYVSLLTSAGDTLHVFINHWPSRRGGKAKSEPLRMEAAQTLRKQVDSIQSAHPHPYVVIAGDFNDEPRDNSLQNGLKALNPDIAPDPDRLYNLSAGLQASCHCGTYRYQAYWDMLDQFILSGSLLNPQSRLHSCPSCLHIGTFGFLLLDDAKYGGQKPFRTYQGPAYQGGFSDHLPIYLDLYF